MKQGGGDKGAELGEEGGENSLEHISASSALNGTSSSEGKTFFFFLILKLGKVLEILPKVTSLDHVCPEPRWK